MLVLEKYLTVSISQYREQLHKDILYIYKFNNGQ
jgi:hypothetical protein